jgi:hypothetical protein
MPARPGCKTSIRVRGRNLSLGARQRGIAHRFPSMRLRGMDSHASSKRRQKGVDSFRGRCGAPDRKRKLAVGCDGRGEVLHCCTPLSQPARYSYARRHPFVPSPHCVPARLRNHHPPPEEQTPSQNRSRLGPGNQKHQQSNCLLRLSQTRDIFAAWDEHEGDEAAICCSPTLPNQACAGWNDNAWSGRHRR